jgi:hypothetical protein
MQYADQLLDRYTKVVLLAQGGMAGEKDNAVRLQEKMETKYPGIDYQSQLRKRQQKDREQNASDAHAPNPTNGNFGGAYQEQRWQKWTSMAESAFSWASEVAGEVANVDYARRCAEQLVQVKAKTLASAKFQVAAQVNLKDIYSMAHHLSRAQKQVFAQMIGAKVADLVFQALEEEY